MILSTLKTQADEYLNRRLDPAGKRLLPKPSQLCFAILLGILLLQFTGVSVAEEPRTWTSADGTQQIKAEFDSLEDGKVHLKVGTTGKLTIPLEKFSKKDRAYIDSLMAETTQKPELLAPKTFTSESSGVASGSGSLNGTSLIANQQLQEVAAELGVETRNGVPVVRDDWRNSDPGKSAQALALAKLFDRIAISVSPEFVEKLAPVIIANHFPRNVAQQYLSQHKYFLRKNPLLAAQSSRWKGVDEFETRSTQKEFFAKHRQDLEDLGIKLPGRFLFVSKVFFHPYDFERGGMVLADFGNFDETTDQFAVLASTQSTQGYVKYIRSPVRIPPFWTVQPDTVRKLASVNNRRIAYLAQEIVLYEPPTRSARQASFLPPLIARLNSARVYADEKLTQPVDEWKVDQFPQSVLLGGASEESSMAVPIPLDELSIAGLMMQHLSTEFADEAWLDMWNELKKNDIEKYVAVGEAIKEEASSHAFLSRLNADEASTRQSDNTSQRRESAQDAIAYSTAKTKRLMSLHNRPFFSPQPPSSGTKRVLEDSHRKALQEWVVSRVTSTNNRFFLLGKIKKNEQFNQPEFRTPAKYISPVLKDAGFEIDHVLRMGNKMTIENRFHPVKSVRSWDEHRFREDFLRFGENRGTAVTFAFQNRVDDLLKMIPQNLLDEIYADSRSDYQRVVQIEVNVQRLELLKSRENNGISELVVHLLPTDVRLFHHRRLIFEKHLDEVDGSQIAKPESPIQDMKSSTEIPSTQMKSEDNPLTPNAGEPVAQHGNAEAIELTPAMIPLMIAKFQPEFFESHLDQFIVTRLQHEHWFRTDPNRNVYGVDQALGEALPVFADMPDAAARKALTTKFKAWSDKNMNGATGPFTMRFDDVEFKHGVFHTTPSPAFFHGMQNGSPFYGNPFRPLYTAKSAFSREERQIRNTELSIAANEQFNPGGDNRSDALKDAFAKQKKNFAAWENAITRPPREIYFSTRRFEYVVPDSNGNRSIKQQGASMGGSSSGGISGIPIAKPTTEPVFPVLSIDKEIWLPENAAIDAGAGRLQLEITLEPKEVEILDQPLPHPWIEAYLRYSPQNVRSETEAYRSKCDSGQYAMIHAELKAARIVNADTGATVLQMVLKDARPVK